MTVHTSNCLWRTISGWKRTQRAKNTDDKWSLLDKRIHASTNDYSKMFAQKALFYKNIRLRDFLNFVLLFCLLAFLRYWNFSENIYIPSKVAYMKIDFIIEE